MESLPTPCEIVRQERMNESFTKFHLNNGQVLHRFTAAVDELAHDHPYAFTSHVLIGGYVEDVYIVLPDGTHRVERFERLPGTSHEVSANTIHRLVELPAGECITLIEPQPWEKVSGFYEFRPDGPYRRNWNGDWLAFKG